MTDTLMPEILPHGPDGVVLRLGLTAKEQTVGAVQALRAAIETAAPHGVEEIAGSLTSVYLRFDPARTTRAEVGAAAETTMASYGPSRGQPRNPVDSSTTIFP